MPYRSHNRLAIYADVVQGDGVESVAVNIDPGQVAFLGMRGRDSTYIETCIGTTVGKDALLAAEAHCELILEARVLLNHIVVEGVDAGGTAGEGLVGKTQNTIGIIQKTGHVPRAWDSRERRTRCLRRWYSRCRRGHPRR